MPGLEGLSGEGGKTGGIIGGVVGVIVLVALFCCCCIIIVIVLAVVLTLPETLSCSNSDKGRYFIVHRDAPELDPTGVEPSMTCNRQQPQNVSLSGARFIKFNGKLSLVHVGDVQMDVGTKDTYLEQWDGCKSLEVRDQSVRQCTRINFTLPVFNYTEIEFPPVNVTWPKRPSPHPAAEIKDDAPPDCQGSDIGILVLVPPPEIHDVSPPYMCDGTQRTILVIGRYLFEQERNGSGVVERPLVEIERSSQPGNFIVPFDAISLDNCSAVPVRTYSQADNCGEMSLFLDSADLDSLNAISVTNAPPIDCISEETGNFAVVSPPVVGQVVPRLACTDLGEAIVKLTGSGFYRLDGINSTYEVERFASNEVTVLDHEGCVDVPLYTIGIPAGTMMHSLQVCANVTLRLAQKVTPSSTSVAITVTPPFLTECAQSFNGLLTLNERTVFVFFALPNVMWNGIDNSLLVYVSGLTRRASRVFLEAQTNQSTVQIDLPQLQAIGELNFIESFVPMNTPAGLYDIVVEDPDSDCPARLVDGLNIVAATTLTLNTISPAFVWNGASTGVEITGTGFGDSANTPPRVLIVPSPNPNNVSATVLSAQLLRSSTLISAAVPAGTPAGTYDVIVVNPDGTVGVLQRALDVSDSEPPVIFSTTPRSIINTGSGATATMVIAGDFFANVTSVELDCAGPSGLVDITSGISAESTTSISVTMTSFLASLQVADVCLVRVTNGDGRFDEFSAVSINDNSANLDVDNAVSSIRLNTARYSPSSAVVTPIRGGTQYLTVIGGSNGAGGAIRTSETARIGDFGVLQQSATNTDTFNPMISQLPDAAGAYHARAHRIGAYVYTVGGVNSSGAITNKVYRAAVLDPLDTPTISQFSIFLNDTIVNNTFGASCTPTTLNDRLTWYWQVSAVFGPTWEWNPNGESLPGELLTATLPCIGNLAVELNWDDIPGASGYIVYRSLDANDFSSIVKIAEVTESRWTDFGDSTTAFPGVVPLVEGSLGEWTEVASLITGRARFGGAVVPVNGAQDTGEQRLMFAGAGEGASGDLNDVEVTVVTIIPPSGPKAPQTQNMTSWTVSGVYTTNVAAHAGGGMIALTANDVNGQLTGNQIAIYVGNGEGERAISPHLVDPATGLITSTGTQIPSTGGWRNANEGYCFYGASASLYEMGGASQAGAGQSAQLQANYFSINNINAQSNIPASKVYPGCSDFSAFWFMCGGAPTVGGTPSNSIVIGRF